MERNKVVIDVVVLRVKIHLSNNMFFIIIIKVFHDCLSFLSQNINQTESLVHAAQNVISNSIESRLHDRSLRWNYTDVSSCLNYHCLRAVVRLHPRILRGSELGLIDRRVWGRRGVVYSSKDWPLREGTQLPSFVSATVQSRSFVFGAHCRFRQGVGSRNTRSGRPPSQRRDGGSRN